MPSAAEFPSPHPSPGVLLVLFLILGASLWVFTMLVRRETRHRRLVAMAQWARLHNMQFRRGDGDSRGLAPLKQFNPKILRWLRGRGITLAQIETVDAGITAAASAKRQWNVMLCDLKTPWPVSALRPTAHIVSLVDLFSLSSYPSLMPTERFMVFGSEARAARILAESSAPALLPPDIALVVTDNCLILDFSTRHFDEIEFERLIDLAKQLAPHLSNAPSPV